MAKGYKTGGRAKGTPNKTTEEIKQILIQFIGKNIDSIQLEFDKLEAKEKLFFIERTLKYVLPTKVENENTIKEIQQLPTLIINTPNLKSNNL